MKENPLRGQIVERRASATRRWEDSARPRPATIFRARDLRALATEESRKAAGVEFVPSGAPFVGESGQVMMTDPRADMLTKLAAEQQGLTAESGWEK